MYSTKYKENIMTAILQYDLKRNDKHFFCNYFADLFRIILDICYNDMEIVLEIMEIICNYCSEVISVHQSL